MILGDEFAHFLAGDRVVDANDRIIGGHSLGVDQPPTVFRRRSRPFG